MIGFLRKMWRRFWRWAGIHRIWMLGAVWVIVNGYVRRGDSESTWLPGSPFQYLKHLILKPIACVILAWCFSYFGSKYCLVSNIESLNPFQLIGSVFPNTLGFGIGVYALMFAMPDRFFQKMADDKASGKRSVGPNGFNSIMAFPLCVHALLVTVSPFISVVNVNQIYLRVFGIGLFLYGMMLVIELIAVLYLSAKAVLPPDKSQTQ